MKHAFIPISLWTSYSYILVVKLIPTGQKLLLLHLRDRVKVRCSSRSCVKRDDMFLG